MKEKKQKRIKMKSRFFESISEQEKENATFLFTHAFNLYCKIN
jgi:hypothetical protein